MKATTTEALGFIGRGEGLAAQGHRQILTQRRRLGGQAVAGAARDRWRRATSEDLPPCFERHDLWPASLAADFHAQQVAVARLPRAGVVVRKGTVGMLNRFPGGFGQAYVARNTGDEQVAFDPAELISCVGYNPGWLVRAHCTN